MIFFFITLASLLIVGVLFLLFMFPTVVVKGDSMLPTLKNDESLRSRRLLTVRAKKRHLTTGEVYVFIPPSQAGEVRYVIKRLTYIDERGRLFFEGDNKEVSYDSRYYGVVSPKCVVAQVLLKKGAH